MELVLVRHALPLRVVTEGGVADPPLSELGHRQAAAAAKWLSEERFDALYSSPLLRARETSAPLADVLGVEVQIEDGIAEYDRMAESYIPIEEVKRSDDPEVQAHWKALAEDRLEDLIADAHTFRPRVTEATERLIATHPGQRILAVCHGGVICAALAEVIGLQRTLWFEAGYASIHRIVASRNGIRSIKSINEMGHLRGLD
jgi:2,3-bisphosphoglycerate-dependent phosphoglycerate mutase